METNDSVESLWISGHPEEVYQYEGQWIAVVGERIVAHGPDLRLVVRQARKNGVPLLKFVEPAALVAYGIFL